MTTTSARKTAAWAAAVLLLLAACTGGSDAAAPTPTPTRVAPGSSGTVDLDDRSFTLDVPSGYDADEPAPLVVSLHGYSEVGASTATYLGLRDQSEEQGFLLAYPEGLVDRAGKQYWNATPACCSFDGADPDDDGFVTRVIETVQAQYAVDPKRVFVIGHSNGAFMALRMACHHPDLIAAAVSVAGANDADPSACAPGRPVSVLQVQADTDEVIRYEGGSVGPGAPYPGAEQTVADWRAIDECDASPTLGTADYDSTLAGPETVTSSWSCSHGTEVGLWTIVGGAHGPTWSDAFAPDVTAWMLAHGREA
ncbi:alpha/beta hydrolase family esterase [Cellulomonas sp. FA1]|uniref:alpha/beta hydrolase family esterase n=1 Tax=Cellulomonas sp. FA1 TaxID=1346710 RepID=UPI0009E4AB67|nr:alpha/beta fold hydrolase [Cellulomonas sp. FA1]